MSSKDTNSSVEEISAALRATTKLTEEADKSEELTPEMLAGAIKLAALSAHHQEKLTPASVNAAIKVAKESSNQQGQQQDSLTPESLAATLKISMKASKYADDHQKEQEDTDDASGEPALAVMRAAIALTQENQGNQLVTWELISDALKLAKE